ncbi:STAS domain-containing protein [Rhodobacteraceae bacterium 2CG4]|uniref:STAS domain-containing protein n=1 Tax=Halovulum marinum TaxID=2662447 RepID=A0A6L5Z2I8_9RHOB|nr:SulP family inorganic anion transporter [Halovulum marinum]MSU90737.1 STAS domain-containing protein [Halovulum marinum]
MRLISILSGMFIVAVLAVGFTLSLVSIIYAQAPEAVFAPGVGFALLGAILLCVVGSIASSYRGTVILPQDVTVVLIAVGAGQIAAEWQGEPAAMFPTIVALIVVCTVVGGLLTLTIGTLRLGYLVRFMPYPVIAGFLASGGYMLVMGALTILTGQTMSIWSVATLFDPGQPARWVPWFAAALAMILLARARPTDLLLPGALLLGTAAFYGALALLRIPLGEAQQAGLLIGPFEAENFASAFTAVAAAPVDWSAVAGQATTIAAVACLTVLGTLLHATGLEQIIGREVDIDRELRGTGAANLAAVAGGGLPGYTYMSVTMLAVRFRLPSVLPAAAILLGCAITFLFGADFLSYVPAGLAGLIIAFLGFDLMLQYLVDQWRRMLPHEFAIVVMILLVAAMLGFLQALAFGLLAAFLIFIVSYARRDVVRLRSVASTRRSRVERSDAENEVLRQAGARTAILELSGYLFFGTANRLRERIRQELLAEPVPERIIVDFSRVDGLDTSAAYSLAKIVEDARRREVGLMFTGLAPAVEAQYLRTTAVDARPVLRADLDTALQELETELLEGRATDSNEAFELAEALSRAPGRAVRRIVLAPGEELVEKGGSSSDLSILLAGQLRAEIDGTDGTRQTVARFRPGALVGEIAHYASVERTAWLIADEPSEVLTVDPERLGSTAPDLAHRLDREAARSLARRVMRLTQLLRAAGI